MSSSSGADQARMAIKEMTKQDIDELVKVSSFTGEVEQVSTPSLLSLWDTWLMHVASTTDHQGPHPARVEDMVLL